MGQYVPLHHPDGPAGGAVSIVEISELPVEARRFVPECLLTPSEQLRWIGPLQILNERRIDLTPGGRRSHESPVYFLSNVLVGGRGGHLTGSRIQVGVQGRVGVQMGSRERKRSGAAEGLSQGVVQSAGLSAHRTH